MLRWELQQTVLCDSVKWTSRPCLPIDLYVSHWWFWGVHLQLCKLLTILIGFVSEFDSAHSTGTSSPPVCVLSTLAHITGKLLGMKGILAGQSHPFPTPVDAGEEVETLDHTAAISKFERPQPYWKQVKSLVCLSFTFIPVCRRAQPAAAVCSPWT